VNKARGCRFLLPLILLLLGAAVLAPAQTPEKASGQPLPACVFRAVDLSPTPEYGEYEDILTSMLQAEVANSGFQVLPEAEWDPVREKRGLLDVDLLNGDTALDVAAAVKARLAVTGFYRAENRQLVLEIKCYDVQARAFIQGVLKTGRLTLTMYNLLDGAVKELLPKVRLVGKPPPPPGPVVAEQVTLLSRDEGTEILLAGEQTVGSIQDGSLLIPPIPFPVGSTITVEKRKEGYHLSRESLLLEEPVQEFRLQRLRPKTTWGTEFNWTYGQVLGIGVAQRYYFKPDVSYAAAELYNYIQTNFSDSHAVFHHDLRLLYGGYLFTGPDDLFRLGWSSGAGVILTWFTVPDQGVYGDWYLNLINAALELNYRRFLVYLRGEAKYTLGIGRNLLGRGMMSISRGPSPITLGFMWKW
jgi:hypothetical protein